MSDLEMWSLLIGALLPPLVAVVQQPRWPSWVRAAVGVVASVVAGGVTTYLVLDDAMWEQGMLHAILLVAVAAWTSYRNFWTPTKIAPWVEEKTVVPK